MATITSTIKLVDQMTPTLNKISKAIDRVNGQSKAMGNVRTWNGFNSGARTATKSTHSLYNALRRTAFILGSLKGLKSFANVADTMMNANARINNITNDLEKTKYYMDAIYLSAQRSRNAFMTTANSVGKLATLASSAFDGSMEQVIAFTELMNKMFVISGASAAEASNAMYQLTQAMAAGKLQGDEMRSILENAPMLAQKLAEKLGVSVGEIKDLGAEGKITADIIKDALFESADEIEEKFENMPKTIGQTWTEIANHALNAFRPVIDKVQQFINSPIFEKFKNKLLGIITKVANGIIRLFEILETPRVQNAISKICDAFNVLWGIVSWVGNAMVKVATWICDNWSWIGQIVYAVIAIVLIYKAVMLAVSAAVCIANIAQGISAWIAALMAGQAWAWVILIIVALVAIIYLAVYAWNYFTGSTVSATGVLFGCIAFVIACVWDLLVLIWDLCGTIVDAIVFVGKILWQVFVDICETLAVLLVNAMIFVLNLIAAVVTGVEEVGTRLWDTLVWIGQVLVAIGENILKGIGNFLVALGNAIAEIGKNIWNTFVWLGVVISTWGSNMMIGMSQLCSNLPIYWEIFKAAVVQKFWSLVMNAANAFNSLLKGAHDLCEKMIQPFVNLVNAIIKLFNKIGSAWNSLCSNLTFTVDDNVVTQFLGIAGGSFGLSGFKVNEISEVTNPLTGTAWNGINISGMAQGLAAATQALNDATNNLGDINWSTNDIPGYGDYVDWNSVVTAWNSGMGTFDYTEVPGYNVDWSGIWGKITDAFNTIDFLDMSGVWDGYDYKAIWDAFKADLDQTWNSGNYTNPFEAFMDWYKTGEGLENGINGLIDGIGAILSGLFGGTGDGLGTGNNPFDGSYTGNGSGSDNLPTSLEDLLGGYGANGNGLGDALGSIADNTGSTAGSTGNIEDTLDLAEEELEFLRKLAEQEVINRFTTAEIHVDMTNNNNISSGMDLDGIVTHLSNKLYEELGVVASGVHY